MTDDEIRRLAVKTHNVRYLSDLRILRIPPGHASVRLPYYDRNGCLCQSQVRLQSFVDLDTLAFHRCGYDPKTNTYVIVTLPGGSQVYEKPG